MELTDSQYDGAGALEPAGGGYGKPSGAGENAKPAEGPGKGDGERLDLPVTYVNWREELAASGLPERERKSYEITLNWYLSFCKKARCRASKQSANAFIETVKRERAPERFQIAQWPTPCAGSSGGPPRSFPRRRSRPSTRRGRARAGSTRCLAS